MGNLMALAESDLADSIEGELGMPVILTAPDGTVYAKNAHNTALPLLGMIRFDQTRITETGEVLVTPNPQVTLRRSSLSRIPVYGETWSILIPSGPADAVADTRWMLDTTRVPEGGLSIGFIRLYLQKAAQA
jgi:hypothetical protein